MKERLKERVLALAKKRVTIIAALVIVLYTLTGFFLLPFLIGRYAPGIIGKQLDGAVTIQNVAFNPYSLILEITGFRITEPSGEPLAGFERLHVNVQLSSLFRRALTFKNVIMDKPSLNIVIDGEGNLNLARPAGPEQEEPAPEEKEPFRVLLFNAEVNEARIDLTDNRQAIPATASFHPLTIKLTDISTIPDRTGDYSITAAGGDGSVVDWTGNLTLHPFRSEGRLAFKHIPLETPWAFYRSMLNLLPPGGEVSLETRYLIDLGADEAVTVLDDPRIRIMDVGLQLEETEGRFIRLPAVALDAGKVDVTGRKIDGISLELSGVETGFADAVRPALRIDSVAATGGFLDLAAQSFSLARIDIDSGMVDLIRRDDESLNLERLFDMSGLAENDDQASVPEESDPWSIFLETLELTGFSVHVSDEAVQPDATVADVEDISLAVSRFDGKSPFSFEAGLKVKQGGALKASGTINPSAVSLESAIVLEDLALPLVQPYLAQAADLTLKSGWLSTDGTFVLDEAGGITYRGQVDIRNLDVVENRTQDTMLGWTRLRSPELRFGLNPNGVEMDALSLFELKGKLIIAEDKTINVVEAFRSGDEDVEPVPREPAPEKEGDPFPVKIGRVTLDEGILRFADFSLIPQFDTTIHKLKGAIAGVSSARGARTRVNLDGRVDRYGTSAIDGEINFFDPTEFTDISMIFKNLEMTNFTPYSGKFAGRKIDDGRLSLDLRYRIEDKRLQSENHVVIDSLVLGERVESPDAVSLPLGLAVALLRDANGVIDIGLPVTGSLDDPQFSFGHVIWQTFVNLITRIVSSPFKALGALLGADDETLNEIFFDPGSDAIPPAELEKLDKLIKALQQRPQLKLMVTGRYDVDADGPVLRDFLVRKAFAEASGIKLEPGEDPGPVNFDDNAAQEVLKALFLERYGEKEYERIIADMASVPENGNGETEKSEKKEKIEVTPAEAAREVFTVLVNREKIEQERFMALADQRARTVAAHMTGPGGLEPERVATQPSAPTAADDPLSVVLDLGTLADE